MQDKLFRQQVLYSTEKFIQDVKYELMNIQDEILQKEVQKVYINKNI